MADNEKRLIQAHCPPLPPPLTEQQCCCLCRYVLGCFTFFFFFSSLQWLMCGRSFRIFHFTVSTGFSISKTYNYVGFWQVFIHHTLVCPGCMRRRGGGRGGRHDGRVISVKYQNTKMTFVWVIHQKKNAEYCISCFQLLNDEDFLIFSVSCHLWNQTSLAKQHKQVFCPLIEIKPI